MKTNFTYLITISFLIFHFTSFSQAPDIEWENTIGGNYTDYAKSIEQTTDGGYILLGYSSSPISGDKTEYVGQFDFWILKLNSAGAIEWQNTIGGSDYEWDGNAAKFQVRQTPDAGYIIGGSSNSGISLDKTDQNYNDSYDFWILKLNNVGVIEWQKTIGGSSLEYLNALELTADNGYIIGGFSSSPISFDKTEPSWGGSDYWLVKLNASGDIEWQNTIGGDQDDYLTSLKQTPDGGYIVAGYSSSGISGDKTEPATGTDFWLLKLDYFGNIEWQNTIGGPGSEYSPRIVGLNDGSFILAGQTYSGIGRDKEEKQIGLADYWIIKLSSIGDVEWQNTIGGGDYDYFPSIDTTYDHGFIVAGFSNSGITGDKTDASHGETDFWILKINYAGNIIWQKTIGGYNGEQNPDIHSCSDHGYVILGDSYSSASFDKSENNQGPYYTNDYWVVKLFADTCIISSEICNGLDDDCNGIIDDGYTYSTYYFDGDADGFGNDTISILWCPADIPTGYTTNATDCDDSDPDLSAPAIYYTDADADLFGSMSDSILVCSNIIPLGYASNNNDCNDFNVLINPVTNEVCNNIDDNCNLLIDDGLPIQLLFVDVDDDYFGSPSADTVTCLLAIDGYVSNDLDCNDSDPMIYPGAVELYDGVDNNCNTLIDEGTTGLDELDRLKLIIYPNPASDIINISTPFVAYNYFITDISGKEIINDQSNNYKTIISTDQLSPGIYFIRIKADGFTDVKAFVKE